jgi:hypothetical protein
MIGFNGGLIGKKRTYILGNVNAGVWSAPEQRIAREVASGSGGTTSTITANGISYRLHAFTTVGSSIFSVNNPGELEYLIVAGGGAGGGVNVSVGNSSDGGNGGQVLEGKLEAATGDLMVVVGAGGIGVIAANGGNGGPSVFSTVTASGGIGGLANKSMVTNGGTGGSGIAGGTGAGSFAGNGGIGFFSDFTGINIGYAGGGGGGFTNGGLGGLGGGGRGESYNTGNATAGEVNKGGGGGGVSSSVPSAGKNGGLGVVLIRYPI